MKSFAEYQLILFDFHRTLTSSVYFDQFDASTRNRISDLVFRPPANEHWDHRWMTGHLRYTDVLLYLSERTAIPFEHLEERLFTGIRQIRWNQRIWDFSQAVRRYTTTAIASINNDLFSRFIVPHYRLHEKFDGIGNSYELGDMGKAAVCIATASGLGLNIPGDRVLLIDDKQENIDEFVNLGGEGYLYRSEDQFVDWLQNRIREKP